MTEVRFHWTSPGMLRQRYAVYPPEEGDRTRPFSEKVWSRVETLPMERLREIQLEKIKAVVAFAWERSPFYKTLWQAYGVSPESLKFLEDIQRLPVVRKEDFEASQVKSPLFGDLATFPVDSGQYMKFWSTSGTTGRPRLWLVTREDHENDLYVAIRSLYAYGIRPGWRGYFGFAYPPFEGLWKIHYAAEAMGCHIIPKGPFPTAAMLRNLLTWKADFMVCTPTFAIRQGEVAEQEGIDLRQIGINVIVLAGEPGACLPETKGLIEEMWGAVVHEAMGMTEVGGPILYTCEAQAAKPYPSTHMTLDYCFFEVLDPEGMTPVGPGEEGVMVLTSLFRLGMPVVRMITNDIVQTSEEACTCGRSFPLVKGGVRGRTDDVIFIKGVKFYPAVAEAAVRSVKGLGHEFYIEYEHGNLSLVAEAAKEVDERQYPDLALALQKECQRLTTLTLPVRMVPAGSLPRAEMKSRRLRRIH
ncbi:MAG: AMP-binding protein [Deltaproteobacteria bacterium]|nr:AMP-binding protein [Deltaproteobacteria bacterium]